MSVTIGFGGAPTVRDSVFAGPGFGLLLKLEPSGVKRAVADIAATQLSGVPFTPGSRSSTASRPTARRACTRPG
jgi:hypothetical protein